MGLTAAADDIPIDVRGVSEDIADNVKAHIRVRWVAGAVLTSERRRDQFRDSAVTQAADALKPFGYYRPDISATLEPDGQGEWRLSLAIEKGPAVTVRSVAIEVVGEGRDLPEFRGWRADWPLRRGERLEQRLWEAEKSTVLGIAEEQGFLVADFTEHAIELDLVDMVADLRLTLDTGPRAVMGEVRYHQDIVNSSVLEPLPRFSPGDPYRLSRVERLRTDLWKSGFFDEINVAEIRHLDREPPVVDVEVTLSERKPNTHQGSIGWGTDTEFRTQYSWTRNRLSRRGDSFGLGVGWRSRHQEWSLAGEYRLPRKTETQQYWLANALYRSELQRLELRNDDTGARIPLGDERVNTITTRGGRARMIDIGDTRDPLVETLYAEYLYEDNGFDDLVGLAYGDAAEPLVGDVDDGGFGRAVQTLSLGVEYDWPVINGTGFRTTGHHERGWLFTSQDAWGSDREFTQIYLSSRWNVLFGDHLKLLLRGEVGYTDAKVDNFRFTIEGEELSVSATELPFRYRFKAGGSRSVRGFGYEDLSDNGIGSNNIITASVELEYLFLRDWSVAAFVDTGNAFNDWSNPDLKEGYGVGLRWYTLAGAVRLDVARGHGDDAGDSGWQIHVTIGTPLL